jgi:hypothetical protein
VWAVVKRWLDPVTVEKISILGSNYQTELLKQIPADNLPAQFGGRCHCPEGCALSDDGPWQDSQYLNPDGSDDATTASAVKAHKDNAESLESVSSDIKDGILPDAGASIEEEQA